MNTCDVFLCYRRSGAQTAKLFKRHLTRKASPARVWYSDDEAVGNYRNDIPALISSSSCAVLFVTADFMAGFLDGDMDNDCITALEVAEIARRLEADPDYRIVTVFLDRGMGFTAEESRILEKLLERETHASPADVAKLFSQSNGNAFNTARDSEDELFDRISAQMLPDGFYRTNPRTGSFSFGVRRTTTDLVVWGGKRGIDPANVRFEYAGAEPPLYHKIDRCPVNLSYEIQNNEMISVVSVDVVLKDGSEEQLLTVRYLPIEYLLFYKTLNLPQALLDQLRVGSTIARFDGRIGSSYSVPNAMGMAIMVVTSDNKLLFTRRSTKRGIRAGEYDCSIVEGLLPFSTDESGDEYDTLDDRYLENELRRAFREEVCDLQDVGDVFLSGVAFDRAYGQWNFIGVITTPLSSSDISRIHATREDTYEENALAFVPFVNGLGELDLSEVEHKLGEFLREGFWDMALVVTWSALRKVGFDDVQLLNMSRTLPNRP